MQWIKYSEKKPELNQWVLTYREGRPCNYWMGFYADAYRHFHDEILYWLEIPNLPEEEFDEN